MMESIIVEVINKMDNLNSEYNLQLKQVLYCVLSKYDIKEKKNQLEVIDESWKNVLTLFLARKKIEGRSDKTLELYKFHLLKMLQYLNKSVENITENDLFLYMSMYKAKRNVTNRTLDNVRLIFSSFFSWLNNKGYIIRNPMNGIDKIKIESKVMKSFSDIELEKIRMGCNNCRDRALVEVLYSTGVRVSELTNIDVTDVDFSSREIIVRGKGNKERTVYLTTVACMHLKRYLLERTDKNKALFVSIKRPYNRMDKAGIESILKKIGKNINVNNIHPHRFRRTMATNALNKGMPISEIQKLLGHTKIDTTMIYCSVDNENVKNSHRKYIA